MNRPCLTYAVMACALALAIAPLARADWTVEQTPEGVTVRIDGDLVTEYRIRSGAKPILWPLIGPTGKPVTRAYPMAQVAGEEQDHVHQRSCWFTHGNVNGIDFWSEQPGHGTIEHRRFGTISGGAEAKIVSYNDWLGPDGKQQCRDERRLTFRLDQDRRLIDFDIAVYADPGPVVFGDTKEGSFGTRVASTIRVDSGQGGRIVNSRGEADAAAWGQRADWVDYHGPIDGRVAGIALLNHPDSFRFPTYWHVRTYGLFAANPFGVHDFTGQGNGAYTLPAGEVLHLGYRLVLHAGNEKDAHIAELNAQYAQTKLQAGAP